MTTRLETDRLIMRTFAAGDGQAWLDVVNDPEVSRHTPPGPDLTIDDFNAVLARRLAQEEQRGHAMWAVERKEDGTFIGQCGMSLVNGEGPEIELAYHYDPASWGHGYGTEAATAALGHAFAALGIDRVIALVVPENIGSWRVAEHAGMHLEADDASYYGLDGLRKYVAERAWWSAPR